MISSPVQVTFNTQGQLVHQASGSFPTGSVGQVIAGVGPAGTTQYIASTQQGEIVALDTKLNASYNTISGTFYKKQYAVSPNTSGWVFFTGNNAPSLTQITASNGTRLQVVSTNANDTVAGTGMRKLKIVYLDSNLDRQIETLNLNGTTPVLTTATNIRYFDHYEVVEIGTNNATVGTVTLKTSPDNVTLLTLNSSAASSDPWCMHYVPRNKVAILTDIHVTRDLGNNGHILLEQCGLPTDGRTFITSNNQLPFTYQYTPTLYTIHASVVNRTDTASKGEYIVVGPAAFQFKPYNQTTGNSYITYSIYER